MLSYERKNDRIYLLYKGKPLLQKWSLEKSKDGPYVNVDIETLFTEIIKEAISPNVLTEQDKNVIKDLFKETIKRKKKKIK
jgi:DNA-binding protein YbaB